MTLNNWTSKLLHYIVYQETDDTINRTYSK